MIDTFHSLGHSITYGEKNSLIIIAYNRSGSKQMNEVKLNT